MATGQQIDGSLMEARCGAKVHISLAVGTGDWLVCPVRRTIFNLGPGASVFASGVLDNCPSPVLLGFSR
jgi:hypothetical protein